MPNGFFADNLQVKNGKNEQHWILCIRLKLKMFDFLDQICPKRVCLVENRKSQHHHLILNIRISLGTKFHFKQSWILGPNLLKGISGRKQKKWTPPLNSAYSN